MSELFSFVLAAVYGLNRSFIFSNVEILHSRHSRTFNTRHAEDTTGGGFAILRGEKGDMKTNCNRKQHETRKHEQVNRPQKKHEKATREATRKGKSCCEEEKRKNHRQMTTQFRFQISKGKSLFFCAVILCHFFSPWLSCLVPPRASMISRDILSVDDFLLSRMIERVVGRWMGNGGRRKRKEIIRISDFASSPRRPVGFSFSSVVNVVM